MTQCKRTGQGSRGRHVCLVAAQHPCEEVKGQFGKDLRIALMAVRGGHPPEVRCEDRRRTHKGYGAGPRGTGHT